MRPRGIGFLWVILVFMLACNGGHDGQSVLDADTNPVNGDAGQEPHDGAAGPSHDGGATSEPDAQVSRPHDAGTTSEVDAAGPDAGKPLDTVVAYTGSDATKGVNAAKGSHNSGRQFEVTQDGIVLVDLGLWDEQANGLARSHAVTLFRLDKLGAGAVATPVEGGSVLVPAGSDAVLDNGFRFAPLAAPLALSRGFYAVVAYGLDQDDPYGDGGNVPLSDTGVRAANFDVYQVTDQASPAFPTGGDGNDHSAASFRYQTPYGKFIRIMPLGASITEGAQSSGGGYRAPLEKLLRARGIKFQFVGSMTNNVGPLAADQIHHEGHSGFQIAKSELRDGITEHVGSWLGPTGVTPDLILVLVGTNDVDLNDKLSEAPARMDHLLDLILNKVFGLAPHARLILARLPPIKDANKDAKLLTYNDGIAAIAEKHRADSENISVVDMHAVVDPATEMADNLHPNDKGYADIAQVWLDEIVKQ
jgi:hypothetical protein